MRSKQPKQPNNKISKTIASKAVKLYSQGMSLKQVSKELKIGATTVKNYVLLSGSSLRDQRLCQNKVYFNKEFFNIKDERLAYFWGFFLGDGSVSNNNGINRIKIAVHKKDIGILNQFCEWLSVDVCNVKQYKNYAEFYLRDKMFSSKLMNHWGAVSNKTYDPCCPVIKNKQLLKSFLIGLIDADGTVYFKDKKRYNISMVGNQTIMKWFIKSILYLGYSGDIKHYTHYSDVWSRVFINKKQDVIDLARILQVDECNFLLDRKWCDIKDILIKEK